MTKEYTNVSVSGNKIKGKNIATGQYETIAQSDEEKVTKGAQLKSAAPIHPCERSVSEYYWRFEFLRMSAEKI
jgi:hypothetical protein